MPILRGPQFRRGSLTTNIFTQPFFTVLSITSNIDLKSAATTGLFTTTAGLTLIHGVIIRITTGNGISGDATVSIGINPSSTDLFGVQDLVNVRTTNDMYSFWSDKSTTLIASITDAIELTVTSAAAGTVLLADAYVIGTPI